MRAAADTETVGQILEAFFKDNNLGENGGLDKNWAKLKVGPLYIPFPNTASRKKALVFHDIHHVVTGYPGNWQGETAIGAWEVSTGCGKYYAAWALDLGAMAIGLLLFPRAVYKAFIRGQRSKNLYRNNISQQQAKQMRKGELQVLLGLNDAAEGKATFREISRFLFWSVLSLLLSFGPILIAIWLIYALYLR
jgi:hypothetical protein